MKNIYFLFILATLTALGCGSSSKPSSLAKQSTNANIFTFPYPYATVWKTTLDTVEFDFLMGIEIQEINRGFFTTEMIRDYAPNQRSRFRISGSLISDGPGTMVKLYKNEEFQVNGEWKTAPSNNAMEAQILQRIGNRLSKLIKKNK